MTKASFEKMETSVKDIKEAQWETDRLLKGKTLETEQELEENIPETDRAIKESRLKTEQYIRETEDAFISPWENLVELLTSGTLAKLLIEWNIEVNEICERQRVIRQDKEYEFGITASNRSDVVVTEAMTTLEVDYVNYFLDTMKDFKKTRCNPEEKNIYGAIAYLLVEEDADLYAENQGLFVIRATENSARIINKKTFKPKKF